MDEEDDDDADGDDNDDDEEEEEEEEEEEKKKKGDGGQVYLGGVVTSHGPLSVSHFSSLLVYIFWRGDPPPPGTTPSLSHCN